MGFDHPEYPAVRVALEVLNATENYFWVSQDRDSCFFRLFNRLTEIYPGLWTGLWGVCVSGCRSWTHELFTVSSKLHFYVWDSF